MAVAGFELLTSGRGGDDATRSPSSFRTVSEAGEWLELPPRVPEVGSSIPVTARNFEAGKKFFLTDFRWGMGKMNFRPSLTIFDL